MHQEVEAVEEPLAQEGLHQVQAPDDFHVLVPVTDLAYRAGQIRAELCGPGPREVGPATTLEVLSGAGLARHRPVVNVWQITSLEIIGSEVIPPSPAGKPRAGGHSRGECGVRP